MDGDGDDTHADLHVDDCIVQGAMWLYGGESVGSPRIRAIFDDAAELCRSHRLDAPTRGYFEYALSVVHFIRAEFAPALERLSAARELLRGSSYIEFYADLLHAQIHFAHGQVCDAEARFRKARRVARKHLLLDPVAILSCEVAYRELVLERDPASAAEPGGIRRVLMEEGVPFSSFATSLSVFTHIRLASGAADEVAEFADKMLVRTAGMPAYARLAGAARVSALVIVGRVEEAERTWRRAPEFNDAETAATTDCTFRSPLHMAVRARAGFWSPQYGSGCAGGAVPRPAASAAALAALLESVWLRRDSRENPMKGTAAFTPVKAFIRPVCRILGIGLFLVALGRCGIARIRSGDE